MAERRMFSKAITESDFFLDMPLSTQALYFHLCMYADDDGFLGGYKKIMRMCSATINEFDMLVAKKFILQFDDGIVVIKHWLMHNYLRKDRYKPTSYTKEKSMLYVKENKAYTFDKTQGRPLGIPTVDVGKGSLGKGSLGKTREEEVANLLTLYQNDIQQTPAKTVMDLIIYWYNQLGYELLEEAIKRTAKKGVRNFAYIESILKSWSDQGVKKVADIEELDKNRNNDEFEVVDF